MPTRSEDGCPAEVELLPLATGDDIPAEARSRIEDHIGNCPSCRESLNRLRTSIRDLRQIAGSFHEVDRDEVPPALGKYRVVGQLGKGGQAEVYRVVHPTLQKELVLKLARRRVGDDPAVRARLRDEGMLLAELDHPGLARIYDFDFHDGRPFLVLEFVRGRNLAQLAREESLPARKAAALVASLARALGPAHRRGVVHQDLKPENIVIDDDGRPKIIDFGLARLRHAWAEDGQKQGTISGTVQFMAPEQARGETDRIGPRSDLFALGSVLYFLLTGKAPFEAGTPEEALQRAQRCEFDRSALRARGAPRGLERICLRAMEAKQEDRHASAEDLALDLEAFVRRPRVVIRWSAAACLLLAAVPILFWPRSPKEEADGVPVPASPGGFPLQLTVTRGGESPRLTDALPLLNGDELQIRVEAPRGLKASLFWLDAEGKLQALPAEELPPSGTSSIFVYPNPGFSVPLEGPPGTELILACGRSALPVGLEEVKGLFEPQGPWPPLPPDALLRIGREGARLQGSRGPGALRKTADSPLRRAEMLWVELSRRFEWAAAMAFPHGG